MKFTLLSSIVLFSASLIKGQNPLPQGAYRITNRVEDPAGHQLALTFSGNSTQVTVQPESHSSNQLWVFTPYLGPRPGNMISPLSAPNLRVGFGSGNTLVTVPARVLVWFSNNIDGSFQFSDGQSTAFWGLNPETTYGDHKLDTIADHFSFYIGFSFRSVSAPVF